MADKISGVDPNITNPNNPGKDQAPVDPSNTSSIGQKVEQGVVDPKLGLNKQGGAWEDVQERNAPDNTRVADRTAAYLKKPSPEEINIEDQQQESN